MAEKISVLHDLVDLVIGGLAPCAIELSDHCARDERVAEVGGIAMIDPIDHDIFDLVDLIDDVDSVGFLTVVIFFHGQSISQNRRNKKLFLALNL